MNHEQTPQIIEQTIEAQKKASKQVASRGAAQGFSDLVACVSEGLGVDIEITAPYYKTGSYADNHAGVVNDLVNPKNDVPTANHELRVDGTKIANLEVPSILPVFMGLRKIVLDRRIKRKTKKQTKLDRHAASVAYASTVIDRSKFGESYWQGARGADDATTIISPPRRFSPKDRFAVRKMEHLSERKHRRTDERVLAARKANDIVSDVSVPKLHAKSVRRAQKFEKKESKLRDDRKAIASRALRKARDNKEKVEELTARRIALSEKQSALRAKRARKAADN